MADATVTTETTTEFRIVYDGGWFLRTEVGYESEQAVRTAFARDSRLAGPDGEPVPKHIERVTITTTRRIERIDPEGE